jgi:signal transduction histidine kinase
VVDNLLSNAVKYSPAGGTVLLAIGCQESAGRRVAVLQVRDCGVGIPVDDMPHIFERFRRASNVGGIQGTGIGLAISRMIVEQHDGSISVESVENTGTTFIVRLPLA